MNNGKILKLNRVLNIKAILGLSFLFVFLFVFINIANAATPSIISYKSRLRNASGSPITTPTTIQFSLYSSSSSGAPTDTASANGPLLWTETYNGSSGSCSQITPDSNGYLYINLGSCVNFPSYLDFNSASIYLGVKVGSDVEAAPRVQFASSPFALNSERVNGIKANATATANQLLALDSNLNFNIASGTFIGNNLRLNSLIGTSSQCLASDINGNIVGTGNPCGYISNLLSSATNTLISNVNGVTSTVSIINTNVASSSGNLFQTIINGVISNVVNIINSFSQSVSGNVLTTNINGQIATTTIISSNNISTSGSDIISSVNGVTSTVSILNAVASSTSNSINYASGVLTSNVNGVIATTSITGLLPTTTNSLSSNLNILSSIVNGLSSTSTIINSNVSSSSENFFETIINGISSGTSTIINSNVASSSENIFQTIINGVVSNVVNIINSFSQSVSGNVLTTNINGEIATTTIISSNFIDYAGGILTSNVNGVISTTSIIGLIPTTTNSISSNTNLLTSIVNGVISTSSIINSNTALSSGNIFESIVNGISSTSTIINTNVASSSGNVFQTIVNGVISNVSNIINSFSQTLSGNTLTTVINGITSSTSVISSNSISTSGSNIISSVNGVTSTISILNAVASSTSNSLDYAGGILTSNVNGIVSTTSIIGLLPTTTNSISSSGNIITSIVNGLSTSTTIINSNIASTTGNYFENIINGISSGVKKFINSFSQSVSGNVLTTNINGEIATTSVINTNVASSSGNVFQTIVNGVSSSIANIINSNVLSVSTSTNSVVITSNINGTSSSATFNTVDSAQIVSSTNTLQIFVNGVSSAIANIINSFSQSVSGNILTTNINGVTSTTEIISSNSIDYSSGIITSNVNGKVATTSIIGLLPTTTNSLSSNTNTLTSVVNGVTSSASIINSNNISFSSSTNTLNFSVNGFIATTSIDVYNKYLPLTGGTLTGDLFGTNATFSGSVFLPNTVVINSQRGGALQGSLNIHSVNSSNPTLVTLTRPNNPSVAGFSFYVDTDDHTYFNTTNADYIWKVSGTERMRLTSAGNFGININNPSEKLEVNGNVKADKFITNNGSSSQLVTGDGTLISTSLFQSSGSYESPLSFTSPLSRSGNTISILQSSSSTNGYLSSTDWNTFNNKLNNTSVAGTTNYISKFTSSNSIGNSLIYDNGTSIGIGTNNPGSSYKLDLNGNLAVSGNIRQVTNASDGSGLTVSAPNNNNDPQIQLSRLNSDTFNFRIRGASGSSWLSIWDNTNGNVDKGLVIKGDKIGIGTASISDTLTVAGTPTSISGGSNDAYLTYGSNNGGLYIYGSQGSNNIFRVEDSGYVRISDANSGNELFSFDTDGGFYNRDSQGRDKFNISSTGALASNVIAGDGNAYEKLYSGSAGEFTVRGIVMDAYGDYSNNSTFTISDRGGFMNYGIFEDSNGNSASFSKINSDQEGDFTISTIKNFGNGINGSNNVFHIETDGTTHFYGITNDGNDNPLQTEILRINANGNIGIGTTTPAQKLSVAGNIFASSFVKSGGTSTQFLKADGSVDSNTYLTTGTGVSSFNTRTGAITLNNTDVTTALGYTPYNSSNPSNYISLSSLSATSPLSYNNTTGIFSISQSSSSSDGYLSNTDWNTFNNKQANLVSGTNIKTINGSSLLGSGNLVITVGSATSSWGSIGAGTGVASQTDLVDYLSNNYLSSSLLNTPEDWGVLIKNSDGTISNTFDFRYKQDTKDFYVNGDSYNAIKSETSSGLVRLGYAPDGASDVEGISIANSGGAPIIKIGSSGWIGNGTMFTVDDTNHTFRFDNGVIVDSSNLASIDTNARLLKYDSSDVASWSVSDGTPQFNIYGDLILNNTSSILATDINGKVQPIFVEGSLNWDGTTLSYYAPTISVSTNEIAYGGAGGLASSANFTRDTNGVVNITGTSQTGSNANGILNLAQTWNTTGNPTAIKLNVTNTASGATSKLIDLQVGGSSKFVIDKNGNVGINTSPSSYRLDVNGTANFSATTTALAFVKSGGTSTQFLKADGSVDSTTYWHAGNDGSSSGLDADLLDGHDTSYFAAAGSISGTTNYIPKFISSSGIGNSIVYDGGTFVGIGSTTQGSGGDKLYVSGGDIRTTGNIVGASAGSTVYAPNFSASAGYNLKLGTYNAPYIYMLGSSDGTYPILNFGINTATPSYPLDVNGAGRFSATTTALAFVKSGGTSTQFLKADGSVDSNTYLTSAILGSYQPLENQRLSTTDNVAFGSVYSYNDYNLNSDKLIILDSNTGYYFSNIFNRSSDGTNVYNSASGIHEFRYGVTTDFGQLIAGSFKLDGGTSTQFLKGDGSVDINTYLTTSGGTLSGSLTLNSIPTGSSGNNILVSNGGIISYRTPSQILSDIGGLSTGSNTLISSQSYLASTTIKFGNAGYVGVGGSIFSSGLSTDLGISSISGDIRFGQGSSAKMIFKGGSGSLGIGTLSPVSGVTLDVVGDINTDGTYKINTVQALSLSGSTLTFGNTSSSYNLSFAAGVGGADRMYIDYNTGYVSINTPSASHNLEVNGTGNFSGTLSGVAASFSATTTASAFVKSGGTSAQFLKADGSVDSNSYMTAPSLTSGSVLFSNGTTITQNNSQFFWDNSLNRLGIGTNSPQDKLEVVGNAVDGTGMIFRAPNDYNDPQFQFRRLTTDIFNFRIRGASGSSWLSIWDQTNGTVDNGLVIKGNNVGIGTASISHKLEVNGTGNFSGKLTGVDALFQSSGSTPTLSVWDLSSTAAGLNIYIPTSSGSAFYINDNSGINFSILGNGNLSSNGTAQFAGKAGVAGGNTSANLTIGNNVGTSYLDNFSEYQLVTYTAGTAAGSYGLGINGSTFVFNSGGGAYRFDRGGATTTLIMDTSGNVGIGTTTPAYKLDVNGAIHTNNNIIASNSIYAGGVVYGGGGISGAAFLGNNGNGSTDESGLYEDYNGEVIANADFGDSKYYFAARDISVGMGPSGIIDFTKNITLSNTNPYINFSNISSSTGYGIRSNAGVMQFKNNGGTWTSLGGTTPAGSNGQIQFNNSGSFGATSTLFWNAGYESLGIGTNTPTSFKLEVAGDIGPNSDNAYTIGSADLKYSTGYFVNVKADNFYASATSSSVLFTNSSGIISGDSVNFYWDNTNKRLGIGTNIPGYSLDVNGNAHVKNLFTITNSTTSNTAFSMSSTDTVNTFTMNDIDGNNVASITGDSSVSSLSLGLSGSNLFSVTGTGSSSTSEINLWNIDNSNQIFNVAGSTSDTGFYLYDPTGANFFTLSANTTNTDFEMVDPNGGTFLVLNSDTSNASYIGNGTNHSAIKFGIGTSTPTHTLEVNGTGNFIGALTGSTASFSTSIASPEFCIGASCITSWPTGGSAAGSTGYLQFNNSGSFAATSSLFWDNTNSRLGIGTTTPATALSIYQSYPELRLESSVGSETERMSFWDGGVEASYVENEQHHNHFNIGTSNDLNLLTTTSSPIMFSTNNTEAMRITTGQNVAIGAVSSSYRLAIVDTGTSGAVVRIQNSSAACNINPATFLSTSCTSDRRLKKDITPISEGILDRLTQLIPVSYRWNPESETIPAHNGFIAQDIEQVFPDMVSTNEDGYKIVAFGELIPYTIKGIQELNRKVIDINSSSSALLFANVGSSTLINNTIQNSLNNLSLFLASTTDMNIASTTLANLNDLFATSSLASIKALTNSLTQNNFDLNLNGNALVNVKAIESASRNWKVGEDGIIYAKEVRAEKYCNADGSKCITIDDLSFTTPTTPSTPSTSGDNGNTSGGDTGNSTTTTDTLPSTGDGNTTGGDPVPPTDGNITGGDTIPPTDGNTASTDNNTPAS